MSTPGETGAQLGLVQSKFLGPQIKLKVGVVKGPS